MTEATILSLGTQALWLAVQMAAPLLLVALGLGLVIGMLQAATQINEQTLSFIPRLLGLAAIAVYAGPWILERLRSFTENLYRSIPVLIG